MPHAWRRGRPGMHRIGRVPYCRVRVGGIGRVRMVRPGIPSTLQAPCGILHARPRPSSPRLAKHRRRHPVSQSGISGPMTTLARPNSPQDEDLSATVISTQERTLRRQQPRHSPPRYRGHPADHASDTPIDKVLSCRDVGRASPRDRQLSYPPHGWRGPSGAVQTAVPDKRRPALCGRRRSIPWKQRGRTSAECTEAARPPSASSGGTAG